MHYYSFNINDYRAATRHLTPLEHYVYRELLDTYYLTETPISDDIANVMRTHCLRSAEDKLAIENVLQDFFELQEDGYHHKRADEEIAQFHAKSEKAKASAEKRWAAKANKNKVPSKRNANAMQTHSEGNANHKPITNNHKPITNSKEHCQPVGMTVAVSEMPDKQIFDYWVTTLNKKPSSTKLTDKRKKNIRARLKEGYTVDQIKTAITNCANSAWHMGANERGQVYNDIELICRDGPKLESFINRLPDKQASSVSAESQQFANRLANMDLDAL